MLLKKLLLLCCLGLAIASCKKAPVATGSLQGSWYLKKIAGLNGFTSTTGLDFSNGIYPFNTDGSLSYEEWTGANYSGTWALTDINQVGNCTTAADGTQSCDYFWETTLQLDAVKVGGQQKKTASFEFFQFTDADNFKAQLVPNGIPTHEYSFTKK